MFGNIAGDLRSSHDASKLVVNRRDGNGDVNQLAALGAAQPLKLFDTFSAGDPREDTGHFVVLFGAGDHRRGAADNLVCRVAENPLSASVPAGKHSGEILADDGVLRRFHDGCKPARHLFSASPFGDIAEHQHGALNGAAGVANWGGAVVDGNFAAVSPDQQRVICQSHNRALTQHFDYRTFHSGSRKLVHYVKDLFEALPFDLGLWPTHQRQRDRIGESNAPLDIGGDHGVADAAKRSFQKVPGVLSFGQGRATIDKGLPQTAVAKLDTLEHLVECVNQNTELVAGRLAGADAVVSGG